MPPSGPPAMPAWPAGIPPSPCPLRRYGTKDALVDLALFLCSPAASYMTGAVYNCDGGSGIAGRTLGLS
jgi:NAD(P)-dependent dehydrogenase (short-subunit alcohol dehydrogenase family)